MTFIKICGITNLPDALAAVEAGADALGFNFYRPSPRYIQPSAARKIIDKLPPIIFTVGVFVNESRIEDIARAAGVEALQLHGDESPEDCESLKPKYVIKAFQVSEDFDAGKIADYQVTAVMLDAAHKTLRGGTGQVFDWSVAKRVNDSGVLTYLAGGLSPENVGEAIEVVRPYAVDACSGVEREPGRKDTNRVRKFVHAVRSASNPSE